MGIVTRAQAHRDGISDAQLRRSLQRGDLCRVAAGVYISADAYAELDKRERHRLAVEAAVRACAPGVVVSHASAAVMHGLDCGAVDLSTVHLTRGRGSGGRRSRGLHIHPAILAPSDIVLIDGIAVTSLARTLVDVACTASFEEAAVIGDSARRRGIPAEAIEAVLERARGRRGLSRARVVAEFISSGAESPGESISRVRMRADNWPMPTLQHEIRSNGRFIARVDFFWKEHGVVGEFDGMVKYRSGDPGTTVEREKLREDAIRDAGLEVIRWVWADLRRFTVVRERFDRACVRNSAR